MISVRPFRPEDAGAIATLAQRLTIGTAPWRDPEAVRTAVTRWVADAIETAPRSPGQLLVATDAAGTVAGFVAVEGRSHWSGARDADIGELAVAVHREGQGIGRALVEAALGWAAAHGYDRVSVSTGAGNVRALRLYERCGFAREDVTLSRAVSGLKDS